RDVQAAPRRREPCAAPAAATLGLLLGDHDCTLAILPCRERERDVVGGPDGRKEQDRRAEAAEPTARAIERLRQIGGQIAGALLVRLKPDATETVRRLVRFQS